MSTKTISIKTESYERLKVRKKPNESFSDVIDRLTEKKDLLEFAGLLSDKDAVEMRNSIKKTSESYARYLLKTKV